MLFRLDGVDAQVHVTNSNKAVKETSYMVQVERIGALKFTDTDGGDHALVRGPQGIAVVSCVTISSFWRMLNIGSSGARRFGVLHLDCGGWS